VRNPSAWQSYTPTFSRYGLVPTPLAGQVIATSGAMPAGLYRAIVSGSYGGTADVIDNMALFQGDKQVTILPVVPVANSAPIALTLDALVVFEGQTLTIRAIAAGGAGSVFRGIITITPLESLDPS
jgi:hypothetical protein